MKQALLITAFREFNRVVDICNIFDSEQYVIYVHIDKKSIVPQSFLNELSTFKNVHLIEPRLKINWGSVHLSRAFVRLIQECLRDEKVFYAHIIDEATFPIKSRNYITKYVSDNRDFSMIDIQPISAGKEKFFTTYHFHNLINMKNKKHWVLRNVVCRVIPTKVQQILRIKRKALPITPFMSGAWFSLSRECMEYVINFLNQNNNFHRQFKYTFAAEEVLFATIIGNSHLKDKIINNHRYDDWSCIRNGCLPANLDITDYNKILSSSGIFARKFNNNYSNELQKKVYDEIIISH